MKLQTLRMIKFWSILAITHVLTAIVFLQVGRLHNSPQLRDLTPDEIIDRREALVHRALRYGGPYFPGSYAAECWIVDDDGKVIDHEVRWFKRNGKETPTSAHMLRVPETYPTKLSQAPR